MIEPSPYDTIIFKGKKLLPIHSCVGAIANRGQWEQGCSPLMAKDLGPVRATHKKKTLVILNKVSLFYLYSVSITNLTKKTICMDQPWWQSGPCHHVSNLSRDRCIGPMFECTELEKLVAFQTAGCRVTYGCLQY